MPTSSWAHGCARWVVNPGSAGGWGYLFALAGKVAGKPVVVLLVDDPRFGRLRVTYEPVLPEIKVGDRLVAGQPIGVLAAQGGHCGRSPHCLHLGIKQDDRYLNPSSFIGSGRVVLKPTG